MTSLSRFKQKLRGEFPEKTEPNFDKWTESVAPAPESQVSNDHQEIEVFVVNEEETTTNSEDVVDIESMTKAELDAYANEHHDIQLDRRQSKIKMIAEFNQKLKEKN